MRSDFSVFRNFEIINPILHLTLDKKLGKFRKWQMHATIGLLVKNATHNQIDPMMATAVDQYKRSTHAHTYTFIDALPKSSRASASLHFFSHLCFHFEGFTRAERIAQPDTTYTINTSERHKSGLGMCHGNHFLFLLRAAPGVRPSLSPLRLCLHTWTFVCGVPWYTARAPSDRFSLLRKRDIGRKKDSANVYASSRGAL